MSNWNTICKLSDLNPGTGVCALHEGEQVAIFMGAQNDQLYAVSNFDPVGEANVMSRGLIGSSGEQVYVASPLYKERYNLETGACLDNEALSLKTYSVRAVDGEVQLQLSA
ncbi:MAG: nitrite reductase small subunit NirD [Candidatus Pelagadaptatus aseana]|uniref:nitrite reductase small subunit NirD n=1 Tax=Candidatus Pelagadaptatus aseana TaxID=3120508 RepID=UPI0039B2D701